jgi:hypothetical protein
MDMLAMAYKNSLIQQTSSQAPLSELLDMKTYYPSEEEFMDPIGYIERLNREEDAHLFGAVKIVPPESFKPPCMFLPDEGLEIPTRY